MDFAQTDLKPGDRARLPDGRAGMVEIITGAVCVVRTPLNQRIRVRLADVRREDRPPRPMKDRKQRP